MTFPIIPFHRGPEDETFDWTAGRVRRRYHRRIGLRVIFALLVASMFLPFVLSGITVNTAEPPSPDTPSSSQPPFIILCYHDVRDDVRDNYDPDPMAVSTNRLIAQFAWLKGHGYHAVTMDQIVAARDGKTPLPEKAVLITFDDGLKSIYTRVFPILKLFNYPAVVALMGLWVNDDAGLSVAYGEKTLTRSDFLSWSEIREISGSGLVEFASHSYALHYGLQGNPQGNQQPAPSVRIYDPKTGQYENDDDYSRRIRNDLLKSIDFIKAHTGKAPRIMVWPFGKFNRTTQEIAASLGMSISLTLDPHENTLNDLSELGRCLIMSNPNMDDFVWVVRHAEENPDPRRVVQLSIDDLYDPDPLTQGRRFDLLVERVKQLDINTVFLQTYSDTNHDGIPDAVYFPNHRFPVRADLFNRVAWQLKTRGNVRVYAVMPYHFPTLPEKEQIVELFQDLARYADFDGVVFYGAGKTDHALARHIVAKMEIHRAPLKVVGVLEILADEAKQPQFWESFNKNYRHFLDTYHFTALYVSSRTGSPDNLIERLAQQASLADSKFKRTIFMLQSNSSAEKNGASARKLLKQMETLQLRNAFQYGYYPDDFVNGAPDLYWIRKGVSLRTYPYRKK